MFKKVILCSLLVVLTTVYAQNHSDDLTERTPRSHALLERSRGHDLLGHERFWEKNDVPAKSLRSRLRRYRQRESFSAKDQSYDFLNPKDSFPTSPDTASILSDNVQQAWVSHYASGLALASDVVTAMTIDSSGNVYVTGYGIATFTSEDYVTIKYGYCRQSSLDSAL